MSAVKSLPAYRLDSKANHPTRMLCQQWSLGNPRGLTRGESWRWHWIRKVSNKTYYPSQFYKTSANNRNVRIFTVVDYCSQRLFPVWNKKCNYIQKNVEANILEDYTSLSGSERKKKKFCSETWSVFFQCLLQSWYIACDFQLFLGGTLLLLVLNRRPTLGLVLSAVLLVVCTMAPFLGTYWNRLPAIFTFYKQ